MDLLSGLVPCAILVFLISPKQCLYFIGLILVLQQFDGNILGPKILGNSTGVSSFESCSRSCCLADCSDLWE
ncbi:MAG: hypothetical protein ACLUAR_16955 [Pilosibacter sp.]